MIKLKREKQLIYLIKINN